MTAISQLVDALGHVPVVVGVLTKGSLLIVLAVCLTRALGRAPAAARHIVWSLSVAALLLLPATSWMPWRLELPMLGTARDALGVSAQPTPKVTPAIDSKKGKAVAADPAWRVTAARRNPRSSVTRPRRPRAPATTSAAATRGKAVRTGNA